MSAHPPTPSANPVELLSAPCSITTSFPLRIKKRCFLHSLVATKNRAFKTQSRENLDIPRSTARFSVRDKKSRFKLKSDHLCVNFIFFCRPHAPLPPKTRIKNLGFECVPSLCGGKGGRGFFWTFEKWYNEIVLLTEEYRHFWSRQFFKQKWKNLMHSS